MSGFCHRLEDDAVRSAVLLVLREEHPVQMTVVDELFKIAGPPPCFAEEDQVHRAVGDLVLRPHDQFVVRRLAYSRTHVRIS
jgi:hypothetical protein